MPCRVCVYDSGLVALQNDKLEFVAVDMSNMSSLDHRLNVNLGGGEWGADVKPKQSKLIYSIIINDLSSTYAPSRVPNLNGNVSGRLDLVLYQMQIPTAAVGTRPRTAGQVAAFIDSQQWPDEIKAGMRELASTISFAHKLPYRQNLAITGMLDRWRNYIGDCGIDPMIL